MVNLCIWKGCTHYYPIQISLIQKLLCLSLSSGINKVKKTLLKMTMILHFVFFSRFRIWLANNCQKNFPMFFSMEYENPFLLCIMLLLEIKISWLALCWQFCWRFTYIESQLNSFSMVLLKTLPLFLTANRQFWLDCTQDLVCQIIKKQLFLYYCFEIFTLSFFLPNLSFLF